MKKLQKKDLTQNQIINKYLLLNTELDDEIYDKNNNEDYSFIKILAHEYDCRRLTYDELLYILYDVFQIDKNFNSYSEQTINQLALLGLETQQILDSHYVKAKKLLIRTNHCLNELIQDDDDLISELALQRLKLIDNVKRASKEINSLFNSLTHRECKFRYVNKVMCELYIPNSLRWYYPDDGIIFKVLVDNNSYFVCSKIDDFTDYCFENGVRQGLELHGISHAHKSDQEILYIQHEFNELSKLIDFITWISIEISYGFYNVYS